MKKVGITGGIGSGKSYVARIFRRLGVPVFDADQTGRNLLSESAEVIAEVKKEFGKEVFADGKISRPALGKIVFSDPARLEILNSIIHPAVTCEFEKWAVAQDHPYILKEAAIMIEAGTHAGLDALIVVIAPPAERIRRVRLRDKVSEEEVRLRMDRQLPEAAKVKFADFIISNADGEMLLPQVLQVHGTLLRQ